MGASTGAKIRQGGKNAAVRLVLSAMSDYNQQIIEEFRANAGRSAGAVSA
jgi:hypothetical protein